MPGSSHSLPSPPITPSTRCPLLAVSDLVRAAAQYVANGMDRPRSRPQRLSECVGGLSEAGAPPCLAGPRFAQSPPSELIWARTHFTWSASIRGVLSYCESGSRAGALHQGSRTSHPASLASKRGWQHTTLLGSLRRAHDCGVGPPPAPESAALDVCMVLGIGAICIGAGCVLHLLGHLFLGAFR